MDSVTFLISAVGTVLTLLLVYYGFRTLRLFKTNVAARAWTYISIGAVFFAVGLVMFTLEAIQPMGLLPVGGVVMTLGAVFFVMGLRKNYLFWASKGHFD